MKQLAGALILLAMVAGCRSKAADLPAGSVTSDAVHDDDKYRNFVKVWHYQVTDEVAMNVTTKLRPWLSKCDSISCPSYTLSFSDELKQRDGNWVLFDCEKVAEKIIDRDLVAKVEAACVSIHSTATTYWKGNNDPSEFMDDAGRTWKRQ